jgi:hypothetical protein
MSSLKSADFKLVVAIAFKATKIAKRVFKHNVNPAAVAEVLAVVHLNDTKLRLQDMLNGRDFDLCHDISGMCKNLDQNTGCLENCFRPRFAA